MKEKTLEAAKDQRQVLALGTNGFGIIVCFDITVHSFAHSHAQVAEYACTSYWIVHRQSVDVING